MQRSFGKRSTKSKTVAKSMCLTTFKTSQVLRGKLRENLNMYPMDTLAKLMEKIEQHAKAEDNLLQEVDKRPTEQTKGVVKQAT